MTRVLDLSLLVPILSQWGNMTKVCRPLLVARVDLLLADNPAVTLPLAPMALGPTVLIAGGLIIHMTIVVAASVNACSVLHLTILCAIVNRLQRGLAGLLRRLHHQLARLDIDQDSNHLWNRLLSMHLLLGLAITRETSNFR